MGCDMVGQGERSMDIEQFLRGLLQKKESLGAGGGAKKHRKKRVRKKKKISEKALKKLRMKMRYETSMILFGIVLLGSLIFVAAYYARQNQAQDMYQSLSRMEVSGPWMEIKPPERPEPEPEPEPEEEEEPAVDPALKRENTVDFAKLHEVNTDIYAWIEIPGTKVDYPILQHPTDQAYYLNHTVERVAGLPGSIYSEAIHPKDFSGVQTILYGHNMKNDTMFGSLHDYEKEEVFEEFPYVYIYLPDRTLLYQIFAAVRFSDAYLADYCNYQDEEEFLGFLEEIRQSPGIVNGEMEVPFGSRLLTMSTCVANDAKHRFLVVAVLLGEYPKE